MAEFDRNVHIDPVQVFNFISTKSSPLITNEINNRTNETKLTTNPLAEHQKQTNDIIEPIILPKNAKLMKGHYRITVIYPFNSDFTVASAYNDEDKIPIIKSSLDFNLNVNKTFDIVLTEGIAFLVPVEDIFFHNRINSNRKELDLIQNSSYEISDYAQAWQHSLILLHDK